MTREFIGLIFILFLAKSAGQVNSLPDRNAFINQSPANQLIAFPACLSNPAFSSLTTPESLGDLFRRKLQEEENKLTPSSSPVNLFNTGNILDFTDAQLQTDSRNVPLVARVSIKVAEEILRQLSCLTTAVDASELDVILKKIRLPADVCAFDPNPNCQGLTTYRTISGLCNNLLQPYQGSARTALARLLPPVYDDGLHRPRSRSALGGPLPGCREISLSLGTAPHFNIDINHHWVIYGQYITHDITSSMSLIESGRTSKVGCPCETTDIDMCSVIPMPSNDPIMAEQRCIDSSATALAFSKSDCTLGYKEQMNGNSHYVDLSATYGSTPSIARNLRVGANGLMKVFQTPWSKFELPPGEVTSQTCTDGTDAQRCFSGGDNRIMENVILSAIQAQWLRAHNRFALQLAVIRSDWRNNDEILFQETRKILMALHQHYVYSLWLPILIGSNATATFVSHNDLFSKYDSQIPAVIFNDVVAGVLRLHTFVRDMVSRCRPNGQIIDQVRLNDIIAKARLAYDSNNNGIDSFLCGAMHDFCYSGDGNFAEEMHNHLFETVLQNGRVLRRDIIAMNMCRGREHGIPGYNAYRQLCSLPRAQRFEDLADVMTLDAINKLRSIYRHPDDIDLIVGANHEKPMTGAAVGHVSVCLLASQFRHLKYGDRFFYTHEGQFTADQLNAIKSFPPHCFHCQTGDLEFVARNPFRPPHDIANPRELCSQCPRFDFTAWST